MLKTGKRWNKQLVQLIYNTNRRFSKKNVALFRKNTLISAILFYESTLKSLHEFEGL
jgi:hypothetical protein